MIPNKSPGCREGWQCPLIQILTISFKGTFAVWLMRSIFPRPAKALVSKWNEAKAWDDFVDFYT